VLRCRRYAPCATNLKPASDPFTGKGETMLSQPTELVPTQRGLPAIIDGSGRKARDRIEHFLRATIDNDNTRRAYGRALGSFFAFLEDEARQMAAHASTRTTQLYDRREDRVTLDEVVKINIRG
jgi:hypothetical protein